MALDLESEYPGKVTPADANYPYGSAKNETVVDAFDGTPWEKAILNDNLGLQQGLLNAAGIVPSGNADTVVASQYMQGILYQVMTGELFEDSGAADAYVLAPLTDNYTPAAYKEGMAVRFVPDNTNTGATTVNVSALGAKDIVLDGAALTAGAIVAGDTLTLVFDFANDRFELAAVSKANTEARGLVELATDAEVITGTDTERVVTPAGVAAAIDAGEGTVKGWVNFNGVGALAVNDSFNVTSVTDNGAGDYTVNWDTDFANTDYCWSGAVRDSSPAANGSGRNVTAFDSDSKTAGALQIRTIENSAPIDSPEVSVMAIGDQ